MKALLPISLSRSHDKLFSKKRQKGIEGEWEGLSVSDLYKVVQKWAETLNYFVNNVFWKSNVSDKSSKVYDDTFNGSITLITTGVAPQDQVKVNFTFLSKNP